MKYTDSTLPSTYRELQPKAYAASATALPDIMLFYIKIEFLVLL
jgi:hypothetical protein